MCLKSNDCNRMEKHEVKYWNIRNVKATKFKLFEDNKTKSNANKQHLLKSTIAMQQMIVVL